MFPMLFFDKYWFIFVFPTILLATYAQTNINSTYKKYSRISSDTGYSGYDIARMILDKNGLSNVKIEMVSGKLSDHYDPRTQIIRLSNEIYSGTSVASMSVAAHEVGHAMQHAQGYFPLKIRSAIAPVVSIGSQLSWVFIIIGLMFNSKFISFGILLFSTAVLFQIITLPVEFNASQRALIQLEDGIAPASKISQSKQVLKAAALTYVAATLSAIGQLLRLLAITGNRRRK